METPNMPAERISIYLPDHIRAKIGPVSERAGDSMSARVASVIDRYHVIVSDCPVFARNEWMLMIDACIGWAAWSQPAETLIGGLAAECEDHITPNGAADKWPLTEAQAESFLRRLRDLTAAETMAVLERIEAFWRYAELPTDEAMASAGIVPADGDN